MVRLGIRVLVENAVYYAGGGFVIWKGGRWERVAAAALLVENTVSALLQNPSRLEDPRYISLIMDMVVLAILFYIAFTTDRRWVLLACALQVLSTLTFIARIVDPSIVSWTYITVDIALSFAIMASVVYGAIQYQRRRQVAAVIPVSGSGEP